MCDNDCARRTVARMEHTYLRPAVDKCKALILERREAQRIGANCAGESTVTEVAWELLDDLDELMLELLDEPELVRKAPELMDELMLESLPRRAWIKLQDSGPTASLSASVSWMITDRVVEHALVELEEHARAVDDATLAALVGALVAELESPT